MNRRNLFQRAGATAIGALAALIGIRPKRAVECSPSDWIAPCCKIDTFVDTFPFYVYEFPLALPCKITLDNTGDGPLQLWFNDRFYVDLPKERYTDSVCVDWVKAKEWDDKYTAECRVCPDFGEPWEVLPMKRVDG